MAGGLALALTAAAAFVALVVRSRLGFGFSLVFVPIMATYSNVEQAVHTAIALEVVVGGLLAWQNRGALKMGEAVWLKLCGVAGLGVGILMREWVSLRTLIVSAMCAIAAASVLQLLDLKRRVRGSKRLLAAAGLASGALNSWTSFSGPPVVLYYLATEETEDGVKGSLSGYFVLLYGVTLIALIGLGKYSGYQAVPELVAGLVTVAAGQNVARRLAECRPSVRLKPLSLAVLLVTSVVTGVLAL